AEVVRGQPRARSVRADVARQHQQVRARRRVRDENHPRPAGILAQAGARARLHAAFAGRQRAGAVGGARHHRDRPAARHPGA
ncbi:hypothetical protein OY671_012684, partial [Metschnikowia pulcherrima]